MNITVNVDEVSLSTAVADVVGFDSETGEPFQEGTRTIADLVAEMIVNRLQRDTSWPSLREKFLEIRTEEIRKAVRPQIEEAVAAPIQKTNTYGEPVSGQTTTLREVIVEEARKAVNAPADRHGYDRQTFLQKTVAEEVRKALQAEIASAVTAARQQVAKQIGEQVAAAVEAGMRKR